MKLGIPCTASDLIALLDAAGIRRALVSSMAYTWGSPNRAVENEYEKVRAENDWTARQVARFPDRLRAFCSFNPIRSYALDELARCARDPRLGVGLKLHFANSVVDLHDRRHVDQLRRVFRGANDHRMPIVVHLRSSLSRGLPYGRDEARIFLNDILPAAPDVPVQIAHLAGAGGYDDPTTDAALAVFAEAIANRDPRARHLYFDVSESSAVGSASPWKRRTSSPHASGSSASSASSSDPTPPRGETSLPERRGSHFGSCP